jgi:hypothetical protein
MERKGINEYSLDGEVLWVNGQRIQFANEQLAKEFLTDLLKDYILNL